VPLFSVSPSTNWRPRSFFGLGSAVHVDFLWFFLIALFALLSTFAYNQRMSTSISPPVLLRRIAQLEATMGRLSEDLGSLRLAVSKQGLQLPRALSVRARATKAESVPAHAQHFQRAQAAGGLAGDTARGEAARVQWVKDGLVVPGEQLAQAWGLTRQALAPAADRGEVFAVKVGNRLYYPQAFLNLDRETVAVICRALGDIGTNERLMFWLRDHGALAGKSVSAALEAGLALAKVERLAAAWARERGVVGGVGKSDADADPNAVRVAKKTNRTRSR
jgi:type II secretory pathway component PulJ